MRPTFLVSTLILSMAISGTALAETTIAGIDLSMTVKERVKTLEKRGFECDNPYNVPKTNIVITSCNRRFNVISIQDEKIRYSCDNFNACDLSLKEFAQLIVDRNIIDSLKPQEKRYCGFTDSEEKICAQHRPYTKTVELEIKKT